MEIKTKISAFCSNRMVLVQQLSCAFQNTKNASYKKNLQRQCGLELEKAGLYHRSLKPFNWDGELPGDFEEEAKLPPDTPKKP